jgi:hypothetical protein
MPRARSLRAAALAAAAALCAACAALGIVAPADWNDAQIAWQSYEAGRALARRERKPMLLLFYTQGCQHSPAYSWIFHAPEVVARARELVMVRVDADLAPELDARFMPDGPYVPRTLFLDPDGVPDFGIHGADPSHRHFLDYESPRELLELMERARALAARPES